MPAGDLTAQHLMSVIQSAVRHRGIPGVAVAVETSVGSSVAVDGVTGGVDSLAITPTTLFQTGSISKLVTVLLVLRLVDREILDLDAPLGDVLPKLPDSPWDGPALTLRHLLTHTGGFDGDYHLDTGRGDEALSMLLPLVGDRFAPAGVQFSYSNLGYAIAGLAAATACREPFESVARSCVLDPLGMHDSLYFAEDMLGRRIASGHRLTAEGVVPSGWGRPRCRAPNGGLVSSALDLIRLGRAVCTNRDVTGQAVLKASSAALLAGRHTDAGGASDWGGLGIFVDCEQETRLCWHDGATPGFRSLLVWSPVEHLVVTVVMNASHAPELGRELYQAVWSSVVGDEAGQVTAMTTADDGRAERCGVYRSMSAIDYNHAGPLEIRIDETKGASFDAGGGLVLTRLSPEPSPPRPMWTGGTRFVVGDNRFADERGAFVHDRGGRVHGICWAGRLLPRCDSTGRRT